MLKIIIPAIEGFDEEKNEFVEIKPSKELQLEHSLVSISKWESKWKKPFLSISNDPKTEEETLDYIRQMTITQNVDDSIYSRIRQNHIDEISAYIDDPMTATTFVETDQKKSRQIITSEIIYYWMITFNIPIEFQKWHLNRLLTLIRVCNIRNQPPKKIGRKKAAQQQKALNDARRAQYGTSG